MFRELLPAGRAGSRRPGRLPPCERRRRCPGTSARVAASEKQARPSFLPPERFLRGAAWLATAPIRRDETRLNTRHRNVGRPEWIVGHRKLSCASRRRDSTLTECWQSPAASGDRTNAGLHPCVFSTEFIGWFPEVSSELLNGVQVALDRGRRIIAGLEIFPGFVLRRHRHQPAPARCALMIGTGG